MKKLSTETLLKNINEIAECSIEFIENYMIQYNIFEQKEPENLAFNGYCTLISYKMKLSEMYNTFKNDFDKIGRFSNEEIEDLLFSIKEKLSHFYYEQLQSQEIISHEFLYSDDKRFEKEVIKIKTKLSGFLKVQNNTLKRMREFITMRKNKKEVTIITQLGWFAGYTALIELITALWKYGAIKKVNGEPITKKKCNRSV